MTSPLIDSLTAAVRAAPEDQPLRLHLAELLIAQGRSAEAVPHIDVVLASNPTNTHALSLKRTGLGVPEPPAEATKSADPEAVWEVETPTTTLADVAGMQDVKDRLAEVFLDPLRAADGVGLSGKSLPGGILLYGPPNCGKAFIARSLAGDIGASFMAVSLADLRARYTEGSPLDLSSFIEVRRKNAPVVLFLEDVDAISDKHSLTVHDKWTVLNNALDWAMRSDNKDNKEGVFLLASTDRPWDVSPYLRKPGRFDQSIAVLPPDAPARGAILAHGLSAHHTGDINIAALARETRAYTVADLGKLVDCAVEVARMHSRSSGVQQPVTWRHFVTARKLVEPGAGRWFALARTLVERDNHDGQYDDLATYLKINKRVIDWVVR